MVLLTNVVNDVAMTVLPNAPIDSATGLPVPTIAVATNGGVSVIKDNGTVVDIADDGTIGGVITVSFYGGNKIMTGCNTVGGGTRMSYSYVIPTSDTTASSTTFRIGKYVDATTSGGDLFYSNVASNISKSMAYGDNNIAAHSDGTGLLQIAENEAAPSTGMTNFISSDYNTGWMNGDIKLATLSDTDTTNLGTELVTNGTFTSDVSGWTANASVASWSSVSGQAVLVQDSNSTSYWAWQEVSVTGGNSYRVSIDVISRTNTSYLRVGSGGEGSSTYLSVNSIGTGTTVATFTVPAGVTSVFINIGVTISGTIVFDNVSLKEDVADRSVNGNGSTSVRHCDQNGCGYWC